MEESGISTFDWFYALLEALVFKNGIKNYIDMFLGLFYKKIILCR